MLRAVAATMSRRLCKVWRMTHQLCAVALVQAFASKVKTAKSIVVVGGGPTGIEVRVCECVCALNP
jgi:NADH dehydrogenase FAD-containing subunit